MQCRPAHRRSTPRWTGRAAAPRRRGVWDARGAFLELTLALDPPWLSPGWAQTAQSSAYGASARVTSTRRRQLLHVERERRADQGRLIRAHELASQRDEGRCAEQCRYGGLEDGVEEAF